MPATHPMKLLIAIPALNEEDSICSIIKRCLEARMHIIRNSEVSEVEITVISDGSTDRTVELASAFVPEINLIVFAQNRGYGAAIKEAWGQSHADLLAFLDADGTCDPNFFAPLCRALVEKNACVVVGSRMHAASKMPLVRRIGNMMFAMLLALFSSTRVRDSATGMRVVRRECLDRLLPLSDGLDFTPAMSARCILASELPIYEIDMPYAEREGHSKLRVLKDGLRFLAIILKTALLYRPSRILGIAGVFLAAIACALMAGPAIHYVQTRTVAEWMIYRFVVSQLLGLAAAACFCMGYLARRIVRLTLTSGGAPRSSFDRVSAWIEGRYFWIAPCMLLLVGAVLVYPSYRQLVTTGATYEHWSRFIVMSFLVGAAILLVITRLLSFILDLLSERIAYINGLLQRKTVMRRAADEALI